MQGILPFVPMGRTKRGSLGTRATPWLLVPTIYLPVWYLTSRASGASRFRTAGFWADVRGLGDLADKPSDTRHGAKGRTCHLRGLVLRYILVKCRGTVGSTALLGREGALQMLGFQGHCDADGMYRAE